MRNVSFAFVAGCMLLACGGAQQSEPATPTQPVATAAPTTPAPAVTEAPKAEAPAPLTPAQAMQKTTGEYMAAINAHDPAKMAALYTEDAKMMMPGTPETTGKAAVQKEWTNVFAAFPDFKSNAARVWTKGDVMIAEWVFNGTHKGDMGPMKATNKPVGFAGVDIMVFTPDGKIKEHRTYMDMGTMMAQVGASKQKVRPITQVPQGKPQMFNAAGSPDEQKNVDAALVMYNAFAPGKEKEFFSTTADDAEWDDMTQPETMKGKEAGKKFFKMMTTAFPDMKQTATNSWGIGDYVIVEGVMTGTHKGNLMGIKPTKKSVTLHALDIIQMKNGKIQHGWTYANSAELMGQLGVLPAPGAKEKPVAPPVKKDAKPAPAAKADPKAAAPAAKTEAKATPPAATPAAVKTPAKPAEKAAAKPADPKTAPKSAASKEAPKK